LRNYLKGKVARFWIPEYWAFVCSIEKTSVGKNDKKKLRELNKSSELDVNVVH
jgi:fatty-acyl-CoA synthase